MLHYPLFMGIRGAAIATVLAQLVTVVLGLSYFMKGKSNLELTKINFKLLAISSRLFSFHVIGESDFIAIE